MEQYFIEALSGYWSVPIVAVNLTIMLHLLGALVLGLIVGYERSYHGRAAGMRTYGLVCMASAALTVIAGYPSFWFGEHAPTIITNDPTRTIQGIVTGIGFLGAGIIMKDGMNISGLTTAASIWASSAIGILVGVGFFAAAVFLTLLSAIFMMWGSKLEALLPKRHAIMVILLFKHDYVLPEEKLHKIAEDRGFEVAKGTIATIWRHGQQEWQFVAISQGRQHGASIINWSNELPGIEGLESYRLSHARN
ncbi:MAG: MgtC/SapB family protein [Alphaproteobacteria bacterium]